MRKKAINIKKETKIIVNNDDLETNDISTTESNSESKINVNNDNVEINNVSNTKSDIEIEFEVKNSYDNTYENKNINKSTQLNIKETPIKKLSIIEERFYLRTGKLPK